MALAFMDKKNTEWQQKNGIKPQHNKLDELARLKELVGNLKEKVESIGDQGTSGEDYNVNILRDGDDEKKKLQVPGRKGELPDVHNQNLPKAPSKNPFVKGIKTALKAVSESDADLDAIRKLSGLDK
jgi:hypothetical protein